MLRKSQTSIYKTWNTVTVMDVAIVSELTAVKNGTVLSFILISGNVVYLEYILFFLDVVRTEPVILKWLTSYHIACQR